MQPRIRIATIQPTTRTPTITEPNTASDAR